MATAAVRVKSISRSIGKIYRTDDASKRGMDFIEAMSGFLRSRRMGTGGANGPCRDRTLHEYEYDLKKCL